MTPTMTHYPKVSVKCCARHQTVHAYAIDMDDEHYGHIWDLTDNESNMGPWPSKMTPEGRNTGRIDAGLMCMMGGPL